MRGCLRTTMVLVGLAFASVIAVGYSGVYNVAASAHHWPVTYWALDKVRLQSIKFHAGSANEPNNLKDHARLVAGAAHFNEDCVICHAAPGVKAKDLAEGMYPKPPSLKKAAVHFTPGQLFWILKNGVKMSGMPSWADHSDDELWNAVAFLEQLPAMTPEQYAALVKDAEAAGGMKMQ